MTKVRVMHFINQFFAGIGSELKIRVCGAELYAETVMHGDLSWVGPLAGVESGLPVFHIMIRT